MSDPISCELLSLTALTDNIACLRLLPQYPLKYRAGQYIELLLPNGDHRPYSIANAPSVDGSIEFHIRYKINDPFPDNLLAAVKQNNGLELTGPYGHCVLPDPQPTQVIFICGGTGFAPHKALIEECCNEKSPAQLHLFWLAKSKDDLYEFPLIEQWQKTLSHFQFTPVFTGLPDKIDLKSLVKQHYPNLNHTVVYLAGPYAMLTAAKMALADLGLPDSCCYSDM